MTKEEYYVELERLKKEYDVGVSGTINKFAIGNNPYKLGDLVQDHTSYIKIESMRIVANLKDPYVVYKGPLLKKDGQPRKDGKIGSVHQCNIKKELE